MTTASLVLIGVAIVFILSIVAASIKGKNRVAPTTTTTVSETRRGEHETHDGHTHTPTAETHHEPAKKGVMDRIWEFLGLIFALLILFMVASAAWGFYKWITTTPTPPAAYTAPAEVRNVIRSTTPAEISTNFRFSLEADGPIKVTYEDGQSYVYKPGGGCFTAPTPRSLGPRKFTDPNNPEGHINFRIYRLDSQERVCNQ